MNDSSPQTRPAAARQGGATVDGAAAASYRILCLDGAKTSLDGVHMLHTTYALTLVNSAGDALRELNSNAFDAYVLDYWIADWTGPSLCREIRKGDPHAPVVFYTGYSGEQAQARALRAGANAYLLKPRHADLLEERLRHLLSGSNGTNLLAARAAAEAVETESVRLALMGQGSASPGTSASKERTARLRAFESFIASGGTRAGFERWWGALSPSILDKTR